MLHTGRHGFLPIRMRTVADSRALCAAFGFLPQARYIVYEPFHTTMRQVLHLHVTLGLSLTSRSDSHPRSECTPPRSSTTLRSARARGA